MKVGHHSLEDQFHWARWVKFKFWNFLSEIRNSVSSISQNFCSIDQVVKEIILESLPVSIGTRFLFDRLKRAFDRCSIPLD